MSTLFRNCARARVPSRVDRRSVRRKIVQHSRGANGSGHRREIVTDTVGDVAFGGKRPDGGCVAAREHFVNHATSPASRPQHRPNAVAGGPSRSARFGARDLQRSGDHRVAQMLPARAARARSNSIAASRILSARRPSCASASAASRSCCPCTSARSPMMAGIALALSISSRSVVSASRASSRWRSAFGDLFVARSWAGDDHREDPTFQIQIEHGDRKGSPRRPGCKARSSGTVARRSSRSLTNARSTMRSASVRRAVLSAPRAFELCAVAFVRVSTVFSPVRDTGSNFGNFVGRVSAGLAPPLPPLYGGHRRVSLRPPRAAFALPLGSDRNRRPTRRYTAAVS